MSHEPTPYATHPAAPAAGEATGAGLLSERERFQYLEAIAHGKPRLGDWNYPDMLKRLLAGYDAQVAEAARLRERNAMLGGELDDTRRDVKELLARLTTEATAAGEARGRAAEAEAARNLVGGFVWRRDGHPFVRPPADSPAPLLHRGTEEGEGK